MRCVEGKWSDGFFQLRFGRKLTCARSLFIKYHRYIRRDTMTRTIFVNGRFATPSAINIGSFTDECLITENDKIIYIGSLSDFETQQAQASNASDSTIINLSGGIVVPGFIDGHMHLLLTGIALKRLNLEPCTSLSEIRSAIRSFAAANPHIPRLLCRGWLLPMTNGTALASDLDDLDSRPIFIDSKDLHATWCNTAALKELGITATDPDPPGVVGGAGIVRDPVTRVPTGLLSESATFNLVWPHVTTSLSMEQKLSALRLALKAYSASGFTGLIEMGMDENLWDALLWLRDEEAAEGRQLPVKIVAHWLIIPHKDAANNVKQVERAIELRNDLGFNPEKSPDLRIAGIKIICDGVIDACTAALREPYTCKVSDGESPAGSLIWTPDMLKPVIHRAAEANMQIALHAIGDLAVRNALDVLESHGCKQISNNRTDTDLRTRRHRIEHLEFTHPTDAARLGSLGVTASIQPAHSDPTLLTEWPDLIGPERCTRAFAYAEFLRHGAVLALGTDAPTAGFAPLPNLYTATTRKSARDLGFEGVVNPEFALSLAEAVSAATKGAAWSCFEEKRRGYLEVGKDADFVVLSKGVDWDDMGSLVRVGARIVQTWCRGKCVFGEDRDGVGAGVEGL